MEFGPYLPARRAALAYCLSAGIKPDFPKAYRKLNIARSKKIAQLFNEMEHTPTDPLVEAAYAALCTETLAQWEFIKATDLHVKFSPTDQPYPNPRLAILDITQNNHFYVTPTLSAFGAGDNPDDDTNPLLELSDECFSEEPTVVNDIFRVVHDFFGHCKEGLGFRGPEEDNAYRMHSAMYSPLARRALAIELRGQNCWVNWGPYGESNRKAGMDDTVFSPQKRGLLPEWVGEEGREDPE